MVGLRVGDITEPLDRSLFALAAVTEMNVPPLRLSARP
jgi:hypothetical protein